MASLSYGGVHLGQVEVIDCRCVLMDGPKYLGIEHILDVRGDSQPGPAPQQPEAEPKSEE